MITFSLNRYINVGKTRPLVCDFASWEAWSIPKMIRIWRQGGQLANPANFIKQLRACQVLILEGGDTPTLIRRLNHTPDWWKEMEGKTICAFSAGISALMARSFNVDHHQILDGLGILPYQSIVHYSPDMDWMVDRLAEDCRLPVLCFDERSSIIIKR